VSAPERRKTSNSGFKSDEQIRQPGQQSGLDRLLESNSTTRNPPSRDPGRAQLQKDNFPPNAAGSLDQQPELSPNNRPAHSQPTSFAQPTSMFTGDVYELTIDDVRGRKHDIIHHDPCDKRIDFTTSHGAPSDHVSLGYADLTCSMYPTLRLPETRNHHFDSQGIITKFPASSVPAPSTYSSLAFS